MELLKLENLSSVTNISLKLKAGVNKVKSVSLFRNLKSIIAGKSPSARGASNNDNRS